MFVDLLIFFMLQQFPTFMQIASKIQSSVEQQPHLNIFTYTLIFFSKKKCFILHVIFSPVVKTLSYAYQASSMDIVNRLAFHIAMLFNSDYYPCLLLTILCRVVLPYC